MDEVLRRMLRFLHTAGEYQVYDFETLAKEKHVPMFHGSGYSTPGLKPLTAEERRWMTAAQMLSARQEWGQGHDNWLRMGWVEEEGKFLWYEPAYPMYVADSIHPMQLTMPKGLMSFTSINEDAKLYVSRIALDDPMVPWDGEVKVIWTHHDGFILDGKPLPWPCWNYQYIRNRWFEQLDTQVQEARTGKTEPCITEDPVHQARNQLDRAIRGVESLRGNGFANEAVLRKARSLRSELK